MSIRTHKLQILALVVAILFIGAQFHLCADLTSNSSGSHICPLCYATSSVVTPELPVIALVSVETPFIGDPAPRVISSQLPHAACPRASPSV